MSVLGYPWKVGATSFVIADSVEENVRFLAGKVDDIQLLFFESSYQARLPHIIDMAVLADLAAEHQHTYTVHLPLDLQLGSNDLLRRDKSIDEICRIVDTCDGLNPQAYDLHLNKKESLEVGKWCDLCAESLVLLQDRLGSRWSKLAVENIDYDFGLIAAVVHESGVKMCTDFGHLHHQGYAVENYFATYDVGHVHLHGVDQERDHKSLLDEDISFLQWLGQDMVDNGYGGVVTLELYKSEWLANSLDVLERAWADFAL